MNIKDLREKGLIIFEGVVGSKAYGTSLPSSDIDIKGVYVQPIEDIIGFGYIPQINDEKNDVVFYEIKRFLELIMSSNPTLLELLNLPEDCVLYKNEVFDIVLDNKDKFITKGCKNSFGGYASQQISKSKGQDKKQNWDRERVTRKTPLDFCYFHFGSKSVPLSEYLKDKGMDQRFCGLSKVSHSRDTYALYYDIGAEETDDSIHYPKFGFRGIAFEDSNDIRLSSIPKEARLIGYVSYNKDGYTVHCDDYKSYQTWLENKNDTRWVDVQSHGQKIDGKNMMHCRRLLEVAKEIAEGKGINVRRTNADYLISIRKGEVDLQTLIDNAENDIKEIDELFKNSNLPDRVEPNLINNILINIRKKIYNL